MTLIASSSQVLDTAELLVNLSFEHLAQHLVACMNLDVRRCLAEVSRVASICLVM